MFHIAKIAPEGRHWLAEFPDAPGCQTFADSERDLRIMAQDALEGWLRAHLVDGDIPDRPKRRSTGAKAWAVHVSPALSIVVQLRWARQDAGLSQKATAARAKVSQQQIAKLENPKANPSIETLVKVCGALGVPIDVSIGNLGDSA